MFELPLKYQCGQRRFSLLKISKVKEINFMKFYEIFTCKFCNYLLKCVYIYGTTEPLYRLCDFNEGGAEE